MILLIVPCSPWRRCEHIWSIFRNLIVFFLSDWCHHLLQHAPRNWEVTLNTYLFLTAPSLKHLQSLLNVASKMPLNQLHPLLSVFIICYLYEPKEDDLCFGNKLTPKRQCLHTSGIYLTTTEHKSSFHPPPCSSAIWHPGSAGSPRQEKRETKTAHALSLPRSDTQQSAQMPPCATSYMK